MGNHEKDISAIIDNLRRVIQAVREYSKVDEHATGLTNSQLWVVKILDRAAPLRISDVARQMDLTPATIIGIVDRMEAKGLVTRNRSSQDRRSVYLDLTKEGKLLAAKAPQVVQNMLVKGLSEMADVQFACVDEGMKQLVRLLEAEHASPLPLHG